MSVHTHGLSSPVPTEQGATSCVPRVHVQGHPGATSRTEHWGFRRFQGSGRGQCPDGCVNTTSPYPTRQEMLKYSKSCEGAEDLQEALSSILGILKAVNDSMHLIAITGYDVSTAEGAPAFSPSCLEVLVSLFGGGICQAAAKAGPQLVQSCAL